LSIPQKDINLTLKSASKREDKEGQRQGKKKDYKDTEERMKVNEGAGYFQGQKNSHTCEGIRTICDQINSEIAVTYSSWFGLVNRSTRPLSPAKK